MGVGFRVKLIKYAFQFDACMSGRRYMSDKDSLSYQIEAAICRTITCDIEKDDTSGLRDLVRGLVESVIENFNTKFNGIVMKTITGIHQEQSDGMVMKTVKERNPNWFKFHRARPGQGKARPGQCNYYCHVHIDKVMRSFNQIETRDFVSLGRNCSLAHKASVKIVASIIANSPGLWNRRKPKKSWKRSIQKLGLPETLRDRVATTLKWMNWAGILYQDHINILIY